MIPTIGVMIASYIVFRCLDVLTRAGSSFDGALGKSVLRICAFLEICRECPNRS